MKSELHILVFALAKTKKQVSKTTFLPKIGFNFADFQHLFIKKPLQP